MQTCLLFTPIYLDILLRAGREQFKIQNIKGTKWAIASCYSNNVQGCSG